MKKIFSLCVGGLFGVNSVNNLIFRRLRTVTLRFLFTLKCEHGVSLGVNKMLQCSLNLCHESINSNG
jgi:hypothetical protein